MSIFDLIPRVVSCLGLAAAIFLSQSIKSDAQVPPGYPFAGAGGYPPPSGSSYSSGQRSPLSPGPFQGGAQSPGLQSSMQSNLIQGGANGSLIQGNVDREAGPVNIMFLLDCSYSMKEKLGSEHKPKMNAAKEVLEGALARIPNDVNVGFRVFGQGYSGVYEIDCNQTACLVPLGTHNRNSIIARARPLESFGLTPLTFALRQCADDDFRFTQGPKTIILISDGADTCGGDPCAFISLLEHAGIKLKIDIVGLALTGRSDRPAREQLNCIAEKSGGKYYDANTAGELIESIAHSVDKAISGRVLPRPGNNVTNPESQPDLEKGGAVPPGPSASPGSSAPPGSSVPPGSSAK
jgi:von Willebrand factor type A domain